jgi:hypothetical protein
MSATGPAKQGVTKEQALERATEEKSCEFSEMGSELYANG